MRKESGGNHTCMCFGTSVSLADGSVVGLEGSAVCSQRLLNKGISPTLMWGSEDTCRIKCTGTRWIQHTPSLKGKFGI